MQAVQWLSDRLAETSSVGTYVVCGLVLVGLCIALTFTIGDRR